MTNLQMLIAKTIIEVEQLTDVDVIFIGDIDNNKTRNYLATLKTLSNICNSYKFPEKQRGLKTLKRTIFVHDLLKNYKKHYTYIYLANFHVSIIHHILSRLDFDNIHTFDDGTNNFNKKSVMYTMKPTPFIKSILHRISGRIFHWEDVLDLTSKHYTIFKNKSNIIPETNYIDLSLINSCNGESTSSESGTLNIFAGTVYSDAVSSKVPKSELIDALARFITNYKIDVYIPHPRDEVRYFENVNTLITDKVAEEEILSLIQKGYSINLYGFSSTVQFNLSSLPQVKNFALNSPILKPAFNEVLDVDFITVEI